MEAETIHLRSFADPRAGRERLTERMCLMVKVGMCVGRGKGSVEREQLKGQESESLCWLRWQQQEGLSISEEGLREGPSHF